MFWKYKQLFLIGSLGLLIFDKECVCKNDNSFLCPTKDELPKIIVQNDIPMKIQCKAAYPIEWEFIGFSPNSLEIEDEVISKDFKSSAKCFVTSISTTRYWSNGFYQHYPTGNYTCRSVKDPTKVNSVYEFTPDKTGNIFNVPSRFISKTVSKENNEYILPCPSNKESISASLDKEDKDHIWKPVSTSLFRYDPKFGFFLNASIITNNAGGKYNCIGRLGEVMETVEIQLKILDGTFAVTPRVNYLSFGTVGKSITLTCQSVEEVYFGFGNSRDLNIIEQPGTSDSNPLRFSVTVDLTLKNNQAKGEIFCAKKLSQGTVLHTWKYDVRKSCNCIWNASASRQNFGSKYGKIICSNVAGLKTRLEVQPCSNPTECRTATSCIEDNDCELPVFQGRRERQTDNYDTPLTSASIRCSVENYTHVVSAYASLHSLNFGVPPVQDNLELTNTETSIFKGDIVAFQCNGAKYRFARGFKGALLFKNGSLLPISDAESRHIPNSGISNPYFSFIMLKKITSRDIVSVFCFAPIRNSDEWENVSLPITVENLEPIPLKANQLNCSDLSGTPLILMNRGDFTTKEHFYSKAHLYNISTSDVILKRSISLICRARYPTQWLFEGEIRPNWNDSSVSSGQHKEDNEMSAFCFESKVIIDYIQKNTGNYTCQAIHQPQIQSSAYIYMNAQKRGIPLIEHGRYISVELNEGDEWITFPCRVSQPSVTPQLYEQEEGQFKLLKESDTVKYYPKKGFNIKASAVNDSKIYICSTNLTDTSRSITFLTEMKISPDIQNKGRSIAIEKYDCPVDNSNPTIISRRYQYVDSAYKLEHETFDNLTNSDTIIQDPTSLLKLLCVAIYPIEWFLEGKKMYTKTEIVGDTTQTQGKEMTKTLCFGASLEVLHSFDSRSTGNYTCRKADDESVQSSTYIYSYGDGKYPLLNHGQHKELEVDQTKQWIVIPCRVSHPNAAVQLYQGENNKYSIVPDTTYNPKEGFLIKSSDLNITSSYLCSTQVNDMNHGVSFNIVQKKEYKNDEQVETSNSNYTSLRKKFYGVAIFSFIVMIVLIVLLLFIYRKLRNERALTNNMMGSRRSLVRNPSFLMSEVQNNTSDDLPTRSYDRF